MPAKIAIETLVIWPLYFLYVYLSTVPRRPVDAAFWYAQDIQDRLVELGLTTQVRITRRRKVTLLAGLVLMPAMLFVCVVIVNGARSYLQMLWQTYLLFILMEAFDIVVIDTLWVALSGWWDIPGIEDLSASYKDWRTRQRVKAPRIVLGGIPLAAVLAGIFWLVAKVL